MAPSDTTQPGLWTPAAEVSRRSMLKFGAVSMGTLGVAGVLSACTGSSSSSPGASSSASGGKPKRGGTLRVGAQGGASTDTLDPHNPLTNADNARVAQLYDQLVRQGDDGKPQLVIAESIEPNTDASVWTIKIRSGVQFHDGRVLTAQDILSNFQRITKNKFPGASSLGAPDLASSKAIDATTLQLKYPKPYGLLVEGLSLYFFGIVPADFNPKNPVGTGPFKFKSFTPGTQSTFVRHPNYWDSPLPFLDSIVTTNIADETAQLNALQSGQVDVVNYLSASSVAVLKGAGFVTNVSKTGSWGPFTMRVDQAPFNDPKVRQAMRLLCDREQMIKAVYSGYGGLGNDVYGIYDPLFLGGLPQRQQDIPQAKSLLRAAGKEGLSVTLITTDNGPGQVNAAQVLVTQAKAAGVKITIQKQTPTDYFASSYLKVGFSQDFFPTEPYLTTVSQSLITGAPYSATHQSDPQYDSWYAQAATTTDKSRQADLAHELMKYDYESGGNLIPYFFPAIDGFSKKVHGIEQSVTGLSPGGFNWKKFWMS